MTRIRIRRASAIERLSGKIRELKRRGSEKDYADMAVKHGYRLAQAILANRKERWFDPNEQLPKVNQVVIVFVEGGEMLFAELVESEPYPIWARDDGDLVMRSVRYWKVKPIPPGPWKVTK